MSDLSDTSDLSDSSDLSGSAGTPRDPASPGPAVRDDGRRADGDPAPPLADDGPSTAGPPVADAAQRDAPRPDAVVAEADGADEQDGDDEVIDVALLDAVEQALADVEHALARLEDGTYGQCEACGRTIDDASLERAPTARFCAEHLPMTLR